MNTELQEALRGCAEIIWGANTWLQDVLAELQAALPQARNGAKPVFAPGFDPRCHPGALLWQVPEPVLTEEGKYRLGVHLALHDPDIPRDTLPFCIWQLAGTNEGRVRSLNLYNWDEVPHLDPDGWAESEVPSRAAGRLYHYTDRTAGLAAVRNCAFYTSLDALLLDRGQFITIIAGMISGIQSGAFQVNTYAQKLTPWLVGVPVKRAAPGP